jgi:hypothetical protein
MPFLPVDKQSCRILAHSGLWRKREEGQLTNPGRRRHHFFATLCRSSITVTLRRNYNGRNISTMNWWQYFWWLSQQASEFMFLPGVAIAFIVLIVGVTALCIPRPPGKLGLWKSSYWLVFTQLLFYPAVLVVAAFGAHSQPRMHEPSQTASLCADLLFFLSLGLGIFWVVWMKGLRWLAFGLMLLQQLVLSGAFFVAGMAITGDWL